MQAKKVSSFLWLGANAKEAVAFYVSVFGANCLVSGTSFELFGQRFIAFDGGPHYTLTPAFSIMVDCEDQEEIDQYWTALLADGGEPSRCGWLKDRFGVSWQIVPRRLFALLHHADPKKASRVQQAMMGMQKLDLAALEHA